MLPKMGELADRLLWDYNAIVDLRQRAVPQAIQVKLVVGIAPVNRYALAEFRLEVLIIQTGLVSSIALVYFAE